MRIDLLPREHRAQPLMNPARILRVIIAVVLIVAGLGGVVYEYLQFTAAQNALQQATEQAQSYQSMLQQVQNAAEKRQQLADERAKFVKLDSYYTVYPDLLNQLAAATPDKVWLIEADFPAPGGTLVRDVPIVNKKGLHARASAKFVQMAEQYDAAITVTRNNETVGGTSIMGLMMLAAGPGTSIRIQCAGKDAAAAMEALSALVANRFGEED